MAKMTITSFYESSLFSILILLGIINSTNGGLKWVRVNVPEFKTPGESALLQCDYDLGNDTLYSVKWYKEHEELYRFVPKARPQTTSYPVEGARVDMSKSDSRKVVLHPVNWKTSGLYRCEVSAEAPSFASAQSEARMEVVSFPEDDPIISGVEQQYQIGDEIALNCTSGESYPASILQWYINEQQVAGPKALIRFQGEHQDGLITSTLGLRFVLGDRHFHGGAMIIKCVASLSPDLWRGYRESPVHQLSIKETREAMLLVKSSTKCTSLQSPFVPLVLVLLAAALT